MRPEAKGVHYYVGSFPLEHAHEFQKAFRARFPELSTSYVFSQGSPQVKMYSSPALTLKEWASWKELYEGKCRELALD